MSGRFGRYGPPLVIIVAWAAVSGSVIDVGGESAVGAPGRGVTERVSVSSAGTQAELDSAQPAISPWSRASVAGQVGP
jgi:hypothetical protein